MTCLICKAVLGNCNCNWATKTTPTHGVCKLCAGMKARPEVKVEIEEARKEIKP